MEDTPKATVSWKDGSSLLLASSAVIVRENEWTKSPFSPSPPSVHSSSMRRYPNRCLVAVHFKPAEVSFFFY
jgi:hypothetical protein